MNENSIYQENLQRVVQSWKHDSLIDMEWAYEGNPNILNEHFKLVGIDGILTVIEEAYVGMYTRWQYEI